MFFLFFTENLNFLDVLLSGYIIGVDYMFGLLQPEATMYVLRMIGELIVGRDKLKGCTALRSWFKNVCISCQ